LRFSIAKIHRNSRKISRFLQMVQVCSQKYRKMYRIFTFIFLAYSQICLIFLVNHHHFSYITKLTPKKKHWNVHPNKWETKCELGTVPWSPCEEQGSKNSFQTLTSRFHRCFWSTYLTRAFNVETRVFFNEPIPSSIIEHVPDAFDSHAFIWDTREKIVH
jgi:hypothetical protein